MKFLHLLSSVDPRAGGTVEGARRFHEALAGLGHSGEFASVDSPNAPVVDKFQSTLHALGPATGRYGYSARLLPWLSANAAHFDAVVVNGMWQYPGFAAWRALAGSATPYFVFTHGMLDPWFKRKYPFKHLKKWLYWPWGEYRVLRDARAVLFTCEEEKLLARKSFWLYRTNEIVLSYGTSKPPQAALRFKTEFMSAYPALKGKRILLFLGRIHQKKGCDLLIEAFAQCCVSLPSLHLVMAGPDQEGWSATLMQIAQRRGIADRISWLGMLTGNLKWGAFYASDAFCLPSHQENFGIAIVEALGCGLPVLISNKVNIWREIQRDGAGLVENDTLDGTFKLLDRWLSCSPQELEALRMSARTCFDLRFRIEHVADRFVRLVQQEQLNRSSKRTGGIGA